MILIIIHISYVGFHFFPGKPTVWGSPNYRGARLQVFSGHLSMSLASQPPQRLAAEAKCLLAQHVALDTVTKDPQSRLEPYSLTSNKAHG